MTEPPPFRVAMADAGRQWTTTALSRARGSIVKCVPFYYGWVMVPMAMVAQMATFPGQTIGVSAFNASFRESLQLSHGQLTGAYMIGSLLASLPMLMVGSMMDRFGIRRVMTIVVVLLGGVCMLTSQVSGLVTLFAVFFLLRLIGQGALSLLADNTLAMWFHDRLGTVSGIKALGWAAMVAIGPSLTLGGIKTFGWRWTWCVLGMLVWVTMLPLLAFVCRDRPEEVGQYVDGAANPIDEASDGNGVSVDGLTLRLALRTRAYWIVFAVSASLAMIGTGIVFNIIPLFQTAGRTDFEATAAIGIYAVCMGAAQLGGGMLADRVALHRLMAIGLAVYLTSLACLHGLRLPGMAHGFAVTHGIADGLLMVTSVALWARYYGRAHLGAIRSTIWMAMVAGASMGPFIMGFTYDRLGQYDATLWLFMAMTFVLMVATFFATCPRRGQVHDHCVGRVVDHAESDHR